MVKGQIYDNIDEACARFNVEYEELKEYVKMYGGTTEIALRNIVGDTARNTVIDKFIGNKSIDDQAKELTERKREAKPILSDKITDWRTIAKTNNNYTDGMEKRAVYLVIQLLANKEHLFDITGKSSPKAYRIVRRTKAVRAFIEEEALKVENEIDKLVDKIEAEIAGIPYSKLFMQYAKIALVADAVAESERKFQVFLDTLTEKYPGSTLQGKLETVKRDQNREEQYRRPIATIKEKEQRDREELSKRMKAEKERKERTDKAYRFIAKAEKKARELANTAWEPRKEYIQKMSIDNWQKICEEALKRTVRLNEMNQLREVALRLIQSHKKDYEKKAAKSILKKLNQGETDNLQVEWYEYPLYPKENSIKPNKSILKSKLAAWESANRKVLEQHTVYRDPFCINISRLLSDEVYRKKYTDQLRQGVNSREAIKLLIGTEEFRHVEDSYDASVICRALGIPEITVVKRVEWLAKKEPNMDDFKYTALWDIAITDIYMKEEEKKNA